MALWFPISFIWTRWIPNRTVAYNIDAWEWSGNIMAFKSAHIQPILSMSAQVDIFQNIKRTTHMHEHTHTHAHIQNNDWIHHQPLFTSLLVEILDDVRAAITHLNHHFQFCF